MLSFGIIASIAEQIVISCEKQRRIGKFCECFRRPRFCKYKDTAAPRWIPDAWYSRLLLFIWQISSAVEIAGLPICSTYLQSWTNDTVVMREHGEHGENSENSAEASDPDLASGVDLIQDFGSAFWMEITKQAWPSHFVIDQFIKIVSHGLCHGWETQCPWTSLMCAGHNLTFARYSYIRRV